MGNFTVEVHESLTRYVDIEASDQYEAIDKVEHMYKAEEIVLDYDDFDDVTFKVQ